MFKSVLEQVMFVLLGPIPSYFCRVLCHLQAVLVSHKKDVDADDSDEDDLHASDSRMTADMEGRGRKRRKSSMGAFIAIGSSCSHQD